MKSVLLVALGGTWLAACIVPVTQPLRIADGPWGQVSATIHAGVDGPDPSRAPDPDNGDRGNASGLGLQLGGGWGFLFTENFGMAAGIGFPTFENQQGEDGLDFVTFTLVLGVQNEDVSFVAGGDAGGGGGSVIVGGTVKVAEPLDFPLRLGTYARRYWPWDPDRTSVGHNVTATWEVGGRVRWGILFIQANHHRLDDGFQSYEGFPGDSRGFYQFSAGFVVDAESLDRI